MKASVMDLGVFVQENYLALLLLGGLIIVMVAYREIPLPASKNFRLIVFVLFAMSCFSSQEEWAALAQDRATVRVFASIAHYILQPLVIYLELIIIMPEDRCDSKKNKFALALPLIINTAVYLAAPVAGHLVFWYDSDYHFNRGPLGSTIYIVTFIYLALLFRWSIRSFHDHDRRKSLILLFIIGTAVLTGILEGFNLVTDYIDESFALGIFLYYTYLVTIHEAQMRTSLASKELELSESRVKLLKEQIRPHFVFNSLQIIKSLIRTDQAKAVRCLEDFSEYLHANIDIIKSDKLIPFDSELDHVEAYVSLALADDSKNIEMFYDIKELNFNLPALTIEPLVENALRHGVVNGGTVKLSTYAEDEAYVIVVDDNGVGFGNTGTEKEKDRMGVGIENVRTRLSTLCGGSLDIDSKGHGTKVTVRIPKNGTSEEEQK